MADRLTLKQLQLEINELRAEIELLNPLSVPEEGPVIADVVSIDEFKRLEESLSQVSSDVEKVLSVTDGNETAMVELTNAIRDDIAAVTIEVNAYERNLTEMRQRMETLEEELTEAKSVVTGLRATADTDSTAVEEQTKSVKEMRKQMEHIFERMVKQEQRTFVDEDNFKRFQKERRNESTLFTVTAAFAAGVSLVVLALALAGVI